MNAIEGAEMSYYSGITLAVLPHEGRTRLIEAAGAAKARGAAVAVDPNFRPRLWSAEEAGDWIGRAYGAATIALTSAEEEAALSPSATPAETVLKAGDRGAEVNRQPVTDAPVTAPVDTTGAGDAFDAAYLAARLLGIPPVDAARWGCRLGARVVAHRGAIIPRVAMEDLIGEFADASQ